MQSRDNPVVLYGRPRITPPSKRRIRVIIRFSPLTGEKRYHHCPPEAFLYSSVYYLHRLIELTCYSNAIAFMKVDVILYPHSTHGTCFVLYFSLWNDRLRCSNSSLSFYFLSVKYHLVFALITKVSVTVSINCPHLSPHTIAFIRIQYHFSFLHPIKAIATVSDINHHVVRAAPLRNSTTPSAPECAVEVNP